MIEAFIYLAGATPIALMAARFVMNGITEKR